MNELGDQLVELWSGYMEHIQTREMQGRSVGNMIDEKRNATFEGMMNWLMSREVQ